MRLLFVSKRRPQQRDLVARPYGRFHNLPRALAALGHDVELIVVGHAGDPVQVSAVQGLRTSSLDVKTLGPLGVYRALLRRASEFHPDWVVGFSDMHFGWLARRMAIASGARLAVDAYDNYEAYMPWNLPLRYLWRRSIAAADLAIAAGPQLAERLQRSRGILQTVAVLPMCADQVFRVMAPAAARSMLGLPPTAPLVGYLGSWGKGRGTDILVEAFERVREIRPDARLVLSGRPPKDVLALPGVLATGYVPDEHLPVLTNALNVACVISDETAFGKFSYPSKLCEAMACGTAVAASGTQPIAWMLGSAAAKHVVPIGDAAALASRIVELLDSGKVDYPAQPSWDDLAKTLEKWLSA